MLPFTVGLVLYRKVDKAGHVLLWFLGVVLVSELLGFVSVFSRFWVVHVYTLFEYGFLVWLFSLWERHPNRQKWLRMSIAVFAVIWLLSKVFIEDLSRFDSYTTSLEGVVLMAVSAYSLFMLSYEDTTVMYLDPRFWVACGILIYFTGSLMLFALFNLSEAFAFPNSIFRWPIHSILNIVKNLCFLGAFLCHNQRRNYGGLLASEQ